jgi:hypothetical protein
MPTDDFSDPTRLRSRFAIVALVVGLALGVAVVVFATRDDPGATAASLPPAPPTGPAETTTTIDERTAVVGRLRDILKVRDRAYRERKAELLDDVYTVDCPCLKGDKDAIRQLLKDDAVWVGASTSIQVREIEKVNSRMWIVVATFNGSPFTIETESGQLIRAVEGRSELFRFVLARTSTDQRLLLGFAAPVRGTG